MTDDKPRVGTIVHTLGLDTDWKTLPGLKSAEDEEKAWIDTKKKQKQEIRSKKTDISGYALQVASYERREDMKEKTNPNA